MADDVPRSVLRERAAPVAAAVVGGFESPPVRAPPTPLRELVANPKLVTVKRNARRDMFDDGPSRNVNPDAERESEIEREGIKVQFGPAQAATTAAQNSEQLAKAAEVVAEMRALGATSTELVTLTRELDVLARGGNLTMEAVADLLRAQLSLASSAKFSTPHKGAAGPPASPGAPPSVVTFAPWEHKPVLRGSAQYDALVSEVDSHGRKMFRLADNGRKIIWALGKSDHTRRTTNAKDVYGKVMALFAGPGSPP